MNKVKQWFARFVCWNGFEKITILLIALVISLLLIENGAKISLSGKSKGGDLQVYYFDVGQASSALVVSPMSFAILIDTGGADTASELVDSVKYVLEENSLSDLDYLILTHSDADHVGGTVEILENFDPFVIFRPMIASLDEDALVSEMGCLKASTLTYQAAIQAVSSEGCHVVFHSNLSLNFSSGVTMTMYAPEKAYYSETNSYSPYITIEYADTTFLFTGDATQTRETEFLTMLEEKNISLDVDVLEVPHHGSKYSSSSAFLLAISPTYAVVSAGDSSHPSKEVLSRLEDVGVEETYVTKLNGTVSVSVTEDGEIIFNASGVTRIDITLIVVCLMCYVFMIFKFIDDREARKSQNIFLFRKKF